MDKHSFKMVLRILVVISVFAGFKSAWATAYYVDATGGSDANNGISSSSAWKSLTKVNSTTFLPGDLILLKRGEVWRQTLVVSSNGNASSPITYDSYGVGENPVINGSDRLTQWVQAGSSYSKNLVAAPAFVYYGNIRLTQKTGAKSQVGLHEWDWDPNTGNNTLWVNVGENPDIGNLETNSRNLCIYSSGSNYIVVQNLTLEKSRQQLVQVSSSSAWTIKNMVARNGVDPNAIGARGMFFLNSPYTKIDTIELYGTYGDSGVSFNGCNNSTITNSKIHNHKGDGIYVNNSAQVTVSSNLIYGQTGATSDNIQFNKNTNYKIFGNDTDLNGSDTQKGNIIVTEGSGGLIQGNKCGYGAYGVSCSDSNSIVESNVVHNHNSLTWHSGLYMSSGFASDNITWRYNISYLDNNGILADTSGNDPHTNISIYKNTIYNALRISAFFENISGVFVNNIVWSPNASLRALALGSVASGGTWSSNYNDLGPEKSDFIYVKGTTYSTLSAYVAAARQDGNSFAKNPDFVDPAAADFRLKATSPCIDTGTSSYGTSTPNGINKDIGALKFVRISAPGNLSAAAPM